MNYVNRFLEPGKPQFVIYEDLDSEYRWAFCSKTGEVVASGDSYRSKDDCRRGVELLKSEASQAEIIEREWSSQIVKKRRTRA
jgi:uncharacterized protein YegP (UPF0339 family)